MGWSSRDNNLRRNNKPTPAPEPIAPKPVDIPKQINLVKTDLAVLDERSAKNVATLHSKVQETFRNWIAECQILAKAHGYEYKAISGNRTWEEQAKIYAQGRTAPGKIVTNAKPGYSNHNYGIAVDMGVFKNGKYLDAAVPSEAETFHKKAATVAEKYNIEWGGNWKTFKDYPHFEYKTGKTLSQLRQLVTEGRDIFA
ncbi:MAG: M15 family peptidase [Proteobacteria bacterium]|nr:M15 family peptidase [Pseudomonadota bacterium]NBP13388.1 M15 family peptidase [bacterium]